MTLFLRIFIGRLFGKTAYQVIIAPIARMQKALAKLVAQKDKEIVALNIMIADATLEQAAAQNTLDRLKQVG